MIGDRKAKPSARTFTLALSRGAVAGRSNAPSLYLGEQASVPSVRSGPAPQVICYHTRTMKVRKEIRRATWKANQSEARAAQEDKDPRQGGWARLFGLGGAPLRALSKVAVVDFPCTAFMPLHLQFTIDKRPGLWYGCACYLEQTRHVAAPLTPLDSALPRNLAFCTILVQISPLESALTDTHPVTPLESALTKTRGEAVPRQILLLSRNSR